MVDIIAPTTPEQFDAVRRLCWDYRDFLLTLSAQEVRIVETFYPVDKYAALMDRIEQEHAPPHGAVRLALLDDQPVGCGMFHTLEPGVAEIKRVYVSDPARGTGAGYALMRDLVETCRADDFSIIRMDTGKALESATRLYLSMGFELRDAYYEVPDLAVGHLRFFEMKL